MPAAAEGHARIGRTVAGLERQAHDCANVNVPLLATIVTFMELPDSARSTSPRDLSALAAENTTGVSSSTTKALVDVARGVMVDRR